MVINPSAPKPDELVVNGENVAGRKGGVEPKAKNIHTTTTTNLEPMP